MDNTSKPVVNPEQNLGAFDIEPPTDAASYAAPDSINQNVAAMYSAPATPTVTSPAASTNLQKSSKNSKNKFFVGGFIAITSLLVLAFTIAAYTMWY